MQRSQIGRFRSHFNFRLRHGAHDSWLVVVLPLWFSPCRCGCRESPPRSIPAFRMRFGIGTGDRHGYCVGVVAQTQSVVTQIICSKSPSWELEQEHC